MRGPGERIMRPSALQARGAPAFLRSDNGQSSYPRRCCPALSRKASARHWSSPASLGQNGVAESFNGKFPRRLPEPRWFRSRAEAKVIIEAWRRHYNDVRPHSSLDHLTPNEFVAQGTRPASRQATGRGAAVHMHPRPGPLLNRPVGDKCSQRGKPSQANSGSEKSGQVNQPGRLGALDLEPMFTICLLRILC
jgi:hypothetical protein